MVDATSEDDEVGPPARKEGEDGIMTAGGP